METIIDGRISAIHECYRKKIEDKIELETSIVFGEKIEDDYLDCNKVRIPFEDGHKIGEKVRITITF